MRNTLLYIALFLLLLPGGCRKQAHDEHSGHRSHEGSASDPELLSVSIGPANQKVISSQTLVKPELQLRSIPVNAYGFISPDERRNSNVAARVNGRIEKLHVKYENQYVHKGDRILELYSPELNTFQEELLYAHKVDSGGAIATHAAYKLKLLGVTDRQIKQIIESGKIFSTLCIYSPQSGYILYSPSAPMSSPGKSIAASSGNKDMAGMNSGAQKKSAMISSTGQLREGAYVTAGQTLFWINDLREVWGILSVDNLNQNQIELNDSVSVVNELIPNRPFKTVIRFVEPQYAADQKFAQVRVYLPNPDKRLRVNSLLEATIYPKSKEELTLPASSILFLGDGHSVWKKTGSTEEGNHILEIQFVKPGSISQGRVVILSGLQPSDEVALDAGFLLDRESLVKPE